MTIENLKQIAIKYATTKGSRVPLAPDELCNAVVQYMNSFFSVMTDINTIKVAVTENSGNIVFTITGNTYDGKPITPIVITVDHNDFVTDQEFEEFKTNILDSIDSLNNSITEINNTIKNINDTLENNTTDITGLKNRVDNTETNISEINSTLNNKLDKVSSTTGVPQVYVKEYNGTQTMLDLSESTRVNSIPKRSPSGRMYTNDGISSEPSSVANMRNIADVESKIPDVSNFATKDEIPDVSGFATKSELTEQLNNKRSVISSPASSYVVYTQANGLESNLPYSELANQTSTNIMARRANGTSDVKKGISGENVANMENIADVEAKIPSITNLADVTKENTFTDVNHFTQYITTFGVEIGALEFNDDEYDVSISNATIEIFHYISGGNANSIRITDEQIWVKRYNVSDYNSFNFPNKSGTLALTSDIPDIPEYTNVDSVSYDSTNGAIVAYDGANEIHIPLLAGENVTIDASEDNKKIVISAAGGGGAGDVTAAGNNIFTGENEFRNYTYDTSYFCFVDTKEDYLTNGYTTTIKNGGFDISYYENGERKYWTTYADNQIINKDIDMEGEVVIKFPKKEGTFALTSDIINEPIYFISFYANVPSEPCHLIGTIMSKNSYGTGQKTNEEFAVMLADNLYTNSNEGLAAYGRLANKDILCIYSEDGLSIRCLNEENSEVDLPTVMFFVMETEL